MEVRHERVQLETDRYRIIGDVTLPSEGYRSRLSDMLNNEHTYFLTLTNVLVTPIDDDADEDLRRFGYLSVSRSHIVMATAANATPPAPAE